MTIIHKYLKRINNPNSQNHFDKEGIYHDSPYVKKCIIRGKRLFQSTITSLKQDFLFGDNYTTLCYLSSGTEDVISRFSNLDGIHNIILIDYQFTEYNCIRVNNEQRIYCIPSEVVNASQILKQSGIEKIDFLVDINSGINLGFGFFSVSSAVVLSTYAPLLNNDKFIFIGSRKYLKSNKQYAVSKNYLNCFQYEKRQLIEPTHYAEHGLNFDLSVLTTYHSTRELDVTVFNRKQEPKTQVIQKGNLSLYFIKGNIFDYQENLDVMCLYFRNLFQYDQFHTTFNNVMDFRGTYFNLLNNELYEPSNPQDLHRLSYTGRGVKTIGFVPLKGYDYPEMVKFLSQQRRLTDLYFFYYDDKDLTTIYQIQKMG